LLTAVYAGKAKVAQKELLNVTDAFGLVNKMLYINYAVLNDAVLNGERHPKVWITVAVKALKDNLKSLGTPVTYAHIGNVQLHLIELKERAAAFAIPEDMALFRFVSAASKKEA
jgi:hypothetical protein